MAILITGAAGNLGSLLARHLVPGGHELRLMYHRTPLAADLLSAPNVRAVNADLADPSTLRPAVEGVDVIIHFAGRLFAPRPMIYAAAGLCEIGATIARTPSPLTRDFVRLGCVPHWGDTRRAREELVPELVHPKMESGLSTLSRST